MSGLWRNGKKAPSVPSLKVDQDDCLNYVMSKMKGECISCYMLVFTLLSCVVVSKGGGAGLLVFAPEDVTNNTVESLLSACSNSSSCQGNRTDDAVHDYHCKCDDSCVKYDTCCHDSKHRATSGNVTKPDADVKCVSLSDGSERHVFMVDTYKVKDIYIAQSSRHINNHIFTHCRNAAEDNDNFFLMIPVTSKVTGTTYKNYFCAVCEEDIYMDQLTIWNLGLIGLENSNASKMQLLSALRYSTKFKTWVVRKNSRNIFNSASVSIRLGVPKSIESVVQYCRKGIVAKCATNWTEETAKEKCGSYMVVVAHCEGDREVLYRIT
ncbi:uncharacterized protein CDAR_479391 [Caerostris darwini]|uniref:SMB domain-containing protein n=1 Tax=Caerostris darwini TaxID=1538125 RepID=A0AAV4MRT1_9ARAC|nr:uncharacterized protein CDAR_479391 [Caerostris darwini]